MGLPLRDNQDVLAIINAVEQASSKELAILSDIHRSISGQKKNSSTREQKIEVSNKAVIDAILNRRASGNDGLHSGNNHDKKMKNHDNRVQKHDKRLQKHDNRVKKYDKGGSVLLEQDPTTRKSATKNKQNHVFSSDNHVFSDKNHAMQLGSKLSGQFKHTSGTFLNQKAVVSANNSLQLAAMSSPAANQNHVFSSGNHAYSNEKQVFSSVNHVKADKNQTLNGPGLVRANQARGANGRFASREKTEEEEAKKKKDDEDGSSKSLLKKLTAIFSGKSRGGDLTEAAGTAAGGVLWSAGKEVADLAGSVAGNVVSLKEWNQKRKDGKQEKAKDLEEPEPIRFPTVKTQTQGSTKSQQAFQTTNKNNVTSMLKDQNKAILESDKTIIDALVEIEENTRNGGKTAGGGIVGKLLGGIGAGAFGKLIGKRILSGLATVLGGKAIIKLLRKAFGADGVDAGVPDIGGRKGKGKSKTGAPGKGKTNQKVKGKGKLGKLAAAATASTVAAAAGAKAIFTGADKVDGDIESKPKKKTKAEQKAEKKAKANIAKQAGTPLEDQSLSKVEQKTEAKAEQKTAQKVETKVAENTAESVGKKGVLKAGAKVAAKGALKFIPLIGTAIGAGMDAVEGYGDTDAQKTAFNVGEDQEVSGRQKAEFTAANVLNMGGLVSGASGLLASGARAIGMNSTADALTFDTSDIAKALDSSVSSVKDVFSSDNSDQIKAIKEGTKQTTDAIGKLEASLVDDVPVTGVSGAGLGAALSTAVTGSTLNSPASNTVSDSLNIGGARASVRSFRNNNFGNIKYVGQSDASLEAANSEGKQTFAKYDSPEEGMRGLANQLSSYAEGTSSAVNYQKLDTVRDIITRFAPSGENDTEGYISNLSKGLGVRENDRLDLSNPAIMTKMIRQIATIEGGNPQVTDQFIQTAIGSRNNGKWVGQFNPETLDVVNSKRVEKGLAALKHTDQRADPERQSLTSKVVDGAKAVGGKAYDATATALGEFSNFSDEQLGKMFGNVEGLRVRVPDKGLTLPAGEKMPAGLAQASLMPDSIGKRSALTVNKSQAISADQGITARQDAVRPEFSPGTPIKKPETQPASIEDGWLSKTVEGLKSIGGSTIDIGQGMLADTGRSVLSNYGIDIDNPLDSLKNKAGNGVADTVSSLAGGALRDTPLSFLSDTVSNALGNKSGQLTQEAFSAFASAPPAPVTNLAASGVAPVMQRDKDSRRADETAAALLERIAKAVEKKDPEKDATAGNPNATVHSAQPAPQRDVPVSVSEPALERLFG